ncbi:MAG: hypothetical protein H6741_10550 [Alphaproteobacteria bacterium]|nr:hypothetical protein [Alphaproteobacteria bacterium]
MLLLLLTACGPDGPPPVEMPAQTLTLRLDNLAYQEVEAELLCRCDTTHDVVDPASDAQDSRMETRSPVPVRVQLSGDTVTLELDAASMQNPYTGPEHMLHSPTCEARMLLLLTSPEYEGVVFGLGRDLLTPPAPGEAAITRRSALKSIKADFQASEGWEVHRSQAKVDVSEPLEGELVEVDGAPKLRVGDKDYGIPYHAPHLLHHLGPLTGTGVLSADTVYWSDFQVLPYSFRTKAVGAARVDREKDPPEIEIQGETWSTRLLNPEDFDPGIWTGKIVYHLVSKDEGLEAQHGVYAYPAR